MKEMIEIAKKRSLIWKELRLVLAYIAANIIYLNGQRPGVAQRMTVEEWAAKTEVDDEWVSYQNRPFSLKMCSKIQ